MLRRVNEMCLRWNIDHPIPATRREEINTIFCGRERDAMRMLKKEKDSEIVVSWRPASRSTSFYPTPGGSTRPFLCPVICDYIPIYVPTLRRYLQPANKLIHYSTEQSSSFLPSAFALSTPLSSDTFLLRRPLPRLLWESCQRFSRDLFAPPSR